MYLSFLAKRRSKRGDSSVFTYSMYIRTNELTPRGVFLHRLNQIEYQLYKSDRQIAYIIEIFYFLDRKEAKTRSHNVNRRFTEFSIQMF
jgi:hypothetical protein